MEFLFINVKMNTMKNMIFIWFIFVTAGSVLAQDNKSFCDPILQNEVENISNLGGSYLYHFLISPDNLKTDSKNPKYNFVAYSMVLTEGNTYRFYLKSSTKFPCEAIFNLYTPDREKEAELLTLHQKSGDAVAYSDVRIKKTGAYRLIVSFKDNIKGCALVVLSFVDGKVPEKTAEIVDTSQVYTTVDEQAQFNGGDLMNFRKYVAENFKVDTSSSKGVTGKIFVQFVVNRDGMVQDIKIIRSCGNQKLDEEAIRVLKSSPRWTPGKLVGIKVKEQFILPIQIK
jgi:TonB family protein